MQCVLLSLVQVHDMLLTMKTFVSLAGIFLFVCLIGECIGTCGCMLFVQATHLVAGYTSSVSFSKLFLPCLFFSVSISAVVSCIFMITYTIRHPQHGIARFISFTVLMGLIWMVILPVCLYVADIYMPDTASRILQPPSKNYFRPDGDGIYFYSKIENVSKTGTGLYIDLTGFTGVPGGVIPIENAPLNLESALPFSDVLIRDSLKIPSFLEKILQFVVDSIKLATAAVLRGWRFWWPWRSAGFAFWSLLGVRMISRWRLLNCFFVIMFFTGICIINSFYLAGWDGQVFHAMTIPVWAMNCIIGTVTGIIGILLAIFRQDPNVEHIE